MSLILSTLQFSEDKITHLALDNGPGCDTNLDVADSDECQAAALEIWNFEEKVESGNWGHAPRGCFVGEPNNDYSHLYFNNRSGKIGQSSYKSICRAPGYQKGNNLNITKGNN